MTNTIDQQFVEYIVKSLVSNPDGVQINRRIDEKGVLLELTVDPEDLGRVIGKRGATAQSLRTLLRALGTKHDARYNLKIVDSGDGGPREHSRPEQDENLPGFSDSTSTDSVPADDQVPSDDNPTTNDEPSDDTQDESQDGDQADQAEASDEAESPTSADDAASERISRARKELEDLDDLDV